jgi:hypothetical protein
MKIASCINIGPIFISGCALQAWKVTMKLGKKLKWTELMGYTG